MLRTLLIQPLRLVVSKAPSVPPSRRFYPTMPSRYSSAHEKTNGPGDARPTALHIVKDEGLEGKLTDKVVLITGCSSGIGIETARAMAATGARVFAGVRNVAKGEDALGDILKSGRVELLKMDLNSLESVRQAAEEFKGKSEGLNILINNAGTFLRSQHPLLMMLQASPKNVPLTLRYSRHHGDPPRHHS